MKGKDKTKTELINEMVKLSQKIAKLERAEFKFTKAREAFNKNEKSFRLLYEEAPLPYQSLDRDGNIIEINKAWIDELGYSREEVIGKWFGDFLPPGYHGEFKKNYKRFKAAGEIFGVEVELVKKDRSSIYVIYDGKVAYDEKGNFKRSHCIFRNITEQRRFEEEKEKLQAQLIQSEKMAGIGNLARGIAHEFNNLIQIMSGHAEYAKKSKKPENMEGALDTIISASERITKIVKDIIIFSKSEAPRKEQCEITEVIESALSITKDDLKKSNLVVVKKYKKTPRIAINRMEILQVFLNMITNARDAMLPKGGRLEIVVKQVKDEIEVSFTDTGIGIDKKHLSKVFEPFYTTKGALGGNEKIQGAGLGLSVSYGIVKRHRGMIEVESKVNKGTTFTVKLPVQGGK